MTQKYTIVDGFFPHLETMVDYLKSRDHFKYEDHPVSQQDYNGQWPGMKSLDNDPILSSLFFTLMEKHELLTEEQKKSNNTFSLTTHMRFEEDDKLDWAHTDNGAATVLVYLSETNLDSGTQFFDADPEKGGKVFLEVPFVQNRAVVFYGDNTKWQAPWHKSKKNFGKSIEDVRFTMNAFMFV